MNAEKHLKHSVRRNTAERVQGIVRYKMGESAEVWGTWGVSGKRSLIYTAQFIPPLCGRSTR
jgi:hypothetical protein